MESLDSVGPACDSACAKRAATADSDSFSDLGAMPEDLLTLILQRTILGAESYIPAAVWLELGKTGRLTQELNKTIRNPSSIKTNRRGMAVRYYNLVPALLDPKHALETADPALWEDVQ